MSSSNPNPNPNPNPPTPLAQLKGPHYVAFLTLRLTTLPLLALKQAEADLQKHMADLGVQEDQLAYADRDSARKREETVKDWTPAMLAWLVVGLTVAGEGLMMFYGTPKTVDPIVLGRVLGTWDSALMLVLGYYFGSSAGSAAKTDAINAQMKGNA